MRTKKEVHDSLLTAVDEGGTMCETFVNSAFFIDQSGSFYNPMPRSKLKPFEHMTSYRQATNVYQEKLSEITSIQNLFFDVPWN